MGPTTNQPRPQGFSLKKWVGREIEIGGKQKITIASICDKKETL